MKMVICAMINCGSRSNRDHKKGVKFFVIPSIIQNQCNLTKQRSQRRRKLWLSRIGFRENLDENVKSYTKVCSRHFISGVPAALHDEKSQDWAPSLHLGYDVPCASISKERYINMPENSDDDSSNEPFKGFDNSNISIQKDINITTDCTTNFSNDPEDRATIATIQESMSPGEQNISIVEMNHENINECCSMKTKYADLNKRFIKLGDQLTDLQNDKLDLEKSLIAKDETIERYLNEITVFKHEHKALIKRANKHDAISNELKERIRFYEQQSADLKDALKKTEQCTFTLEGLKNDSKIQFYTGLSSYNMFNTVLTYVSSHLKESAHFTLPPWKSLLLTLMRLRLSLTLQDLAYRFGISCATACRIFDRWLYALYICLRPVINWPDRDTLHKTMPTAFKEAFGRSVAVIIDCFEIFIDKPGSLDTRAMTWSNYKHHYTVKVLIGITPCGAISFISETWGGRVSDKHISENCGLYDKLLPNDIVMADRGFNIGEDIGFLGCKLLVPVFTRGKAQLSSHDITHTRNIASLRIHVERIIGLVRRKYSILRSIQPVEFLITKKGHNVSQIDEMVLVCCALTNLCHSIVVP